MTTVHANSPRDALARVEQMVQMGGMELPHAAIRATVSSALHFVVQLNRLSDGSRWVVSISEITGMEVDQICIQDLFVFRQTGLDENSRAQGHFEACGIRPQVLDRIHAEGIDLSPDLFKRRRLMTEQAVV